ncbi:MAG: nitroreductase family protein, partial [Paludibacteraceae bacterium]|nr:nitroreductase family protein [Paludibacteraceae bacterium]
MDLHNRRTIRKYASTPVSDQLLKDLLQLAARSSNTGNMQTYSVVVTRDEKQKELLSPAHFNQPMVKQAPVVLTFCADYNRFTEWC